MSCFVFLLFSISTTLACPEGCLCANNMIVCACTMQQSTPVLGSFRGIDYISKIYIHSCAKLTIAADTFSGLAVGQEMTIMNVDHLILEPHAFRNMLKYPAHFTIKDSGIDEMGENSFSGFSRAAHMWFRNVTVGVIKSGAFRHVSNIEYVYFRESTVQKIESEAFGYMTSVAHFYVRGKMKLGEIREHIFRKSSIANIMFEETYTNLSSAYAFTGAAYFNSFQFQNCTFSDTDFDTVPKVLYPTENGQKLEFIKTNVEKFSIASVSHVHHVRFEESHMERILGAKDMFLTNVSVLYFIRTFINYVESGSFSKSKNVQSVMFDDCVMDTVKSYAFNGSIGIGYVIFMNSRIVKFESNSFSNATIENFIMDGCEVDSIQSETFMHSKMTSFKLVGVTLSVMEKFALARFSSDYCGLENVKLNKIHEKIFEGIRVEVLNITENTFNSISDESFDGTTSFRRLTFNYNKFSCQCKSVYVARMMAYNAKKELALNLANNFCLAPIANRTQLGAFSFVKFLKNCKDPKLLAPFYEMDAGLVCHKNFMWTYCRCTSESVLVTRKLMNELKTKQTSGLTFTDCAKIRFQSKSMSKNEFSHIAVDHSQVEFEPEFLHDAPYLKTFTIRNCTLKTLTSNTFSHEHVIDSIEFLNSSIQNFEFESLKSLHVKEIRFVDCRLGEFQTKFASGAKLENFTVHNSHIGRIRNGAFNESLVATFHVIKSHFVEIQSGSAPDIFYKNTFICLIENKFSCQCDMSGMKRMINSNGCDDSENICFANNNNPDSSGDFLVNKRVSDIFKENFNLDEYKSSRGCYDEPYKPADQQQSRSSSSDVARLNFFALFQIVVLFFLRDNVLN